MTEKVDMKKDQQKNKKVKQQDGKQNKTKKNNNNNNNSNSNSNNKKQTVVLPDAKKKNKGFKPQHNNMSKSLKKKKDSKGKGLLWYSFICLIYLSIALGILYIVDVQTFTRVRNYYSDCLNKTISLLPPSVVAQGRVAMGYIQPVAVVTVNKLNVLLNETSTFFNSNSLVKDHWINIREISSICGARLVDYMRTLYQQTTGYCVDFKNKFF